jgi:hypothetical protein
MASTSLVPTKSASPEDVPSFPRDTAGVVWRKAKGYIEDVFRTETRWAAREKRFTALTALEYRDRFLIELIQNGYDAHEPLSRDGLVWIRLDVHDGPFGCLYVANGGRPFSESNSRDRLGSRAGPDRLRRTEKRLRKEKELRTTQPAQWCRNGANRPHRSA